MAVVTGIPYVRTGCSISSCDKTHASTKDAHSNETMINGYICKKTYCKHTSWTEKLEQSTEYTAMKQRTATLMNVEYGSNGPVVPNIRSNHYPVQETVHNDVGYCLANKFIPFALKSNALGVKSAFVFSQEHQQTIYVLLTCGLLLEKSGLCPA